MGFFVSVALCQNIDLSKRIKEPELLKTVSREAVAQYNKDKAPSKRAYSYPGAAFNPLALSDIYDENLKIRELFTSKNVFIVRWRSEFSPYCLGSKVLETHRDLITDLYKKHSDKWQKISRIFASMEFPELGKLKGEYYLASTIKKLFEPRQKNDSKDGEFSLDLKKFTENEKMSIARAVVSAHNEQNVCNQVFSYPGAAHNHALREIFDKDPMIRGICGNLRTWASCWKDRWNPNIIKTTVKSEHAITIKKLCEEYSNQWAKIAEVFAKMSFPGKLQEMYYPSNTVKNFFYSKRAESIPSEERASKRKRIESPLNSLAPSLSEEGMGDPIDLIEDSWFDIS